jgi:C_GCAxxG_C_C family probable redox protein
MTSEEVLRSFGGGFDCAQTVFRCRAEQLGLDGETACRIASGFGGGMMRGETCGAVIGAYLALGLQYGTGLPGAEGAAARARLKEKDAAFCAKFRARYPGFTCRELLGADISTEEGLAEIQKQQLMTTFCPRLVADVLELLEEVAGEN